MDRISIKNLSSGSVVPACTIIVVVTFVNYSSVDRVSGQDRALANNELITPKSQQQKSKHSNWKVNESARDVDSWSDEFSRIMALADITNPGSILTWAMECVEGKLRGILQELYTTNEEDNEHFPSMRDIKEAIENSLEITNLEDAFEEAELAERAEEGGNLRNETVMTTVFNSQPYNHNRRQYYFKKTPRNYTNYNENREFTTNNYNTKFNSKNEIMQNNNLENTTQNIIR
ncbi:hypothetical protein H8356DRAFT_1326193 [Neocallimastix lanati (nom. inval.)]|nr:hypothetical protein H8356DRAFT_1326193 [Neocallimastix sp. JGI-2020a]